MNEEEDDIFQALERALDPTPYGCRGMMIGAAIVFWIVAIIWWLLW